MPARSPDLHGNAPDKSPLALLLIDVINDLEFPGSDKLLKQALPVARNLARLKKRAQAAGIPVIYVNDNFGRWQSDFHKQVQHCLEEGVKGEPIARLLKPGPKDYFVLKPKHSGFFSTQLDILLEHLGTETVILTGIAANICVLFTANEAYMRDYELIVPRDCVGSNTKRENDYALLQMKQILKADIRPSSKIRFPKQRAKRNAKVVSIRRAA
jgi:nicotinamidase-related amidase